MRPSILKKVVSVVVCLAFLALIVPVSANAGKKVTKTNYQSLISKPMQILYSLFPYLAGLLNRNVPGLPAKSSSKNANNSPILSARPTGDLPPGPRPSAGD